MRVTVLMTLHNKGPFVEEAVRSVLASTLTDLELLVVDDASTDGGLDIVRGIHDPRIRILESAVNTGRAAAANRGLDAARGTFVAVLDAETGDRLASRTLHERRAIPLADWYRRFGVEPTGPKSVKLNDSAPQAALRRAIMAPR